MTDQQALATAYRWTHFAVISVQLANVCEYQAHGYLEPEDAQWERYWVVGRGRTRIEAIGELVKANLKKNCRVVFERQKWRCAHCGKVRPLQGHHVIERGRSAANRDDRIANLTGICQICHEEKHAVKRQLDKRTALQKLGGQLTGEWNQVGQTQSETEGQGSGRPEGGP